MCFNSLETKKAISYRQCMIFEELDVDQYFFTYLNMFNAQNKFNTMLASTILYIHVIKDQSIHIFFQKSILSINFGLIFYVL